MKTIKYLFIGAMMTMVVAPVNAQVDNNAVNQVKAILQSNPADAAKQINSIAKPFKKNAATLAAIAREYYRVDRRGKNMGRESSFSIKEQVWRRMDCPWRH